MTLLRPSLAAAVLSLALVNAAGADPVAPQVTLEVLTPVVSVDAAAATDALELRRAAVTRCLAGVRKLARGEHLAVMTVGAKGAVTRVDVAGPAGPVGACIKKVAGAKLETATAGAFAARIVVEPPSPPDGAASGLTVREIASVIKQASFAACFPERSTSTTARGVTLQIAGDGTVTIASVELGYGPVVDACIARELKRLRFPAKGIPTRVTYPFMLGG